MPQLAVRTHFECNNRWTCGVTQPVQRTPLWPASWLLALDKSWGSKPAEVQRVSRAWLVWSAAAEAALADACRPCA